MGKLRTHTLGCKVNQYETEFVREGLQRAGFEDASAGESADLCVINTCTVTKEGDAKSRQVIRRMARDNPEARIIVMGCYAAREPQRLAAIPQVVEVMTDKRELPDLLSRWGVTDIPDGISQFGNRQRAFVKVQDGCLLKCTYCIIPQVRPQMFSRPTPSIVGEVQRLVSNGYREVVLTGVHLGHYGVDLNRGKPKRAWIRLSSLLRELMRLEGDFRLRLSSIEATEVTTELLDVMGEFADRICPHLHVCLQSGSDAILQRMHRRWGAQRFLDRCARISEFLDRPALTTDVIVGFPGETDKDFQATCDVVERCRFSKVHIFPFSGREGTPAWSMPDQVPKSVQRERCRALADLEGQLRGRYQRSLVGQRLQVLLETEAEHDGRPYLRGTSCRYLPTSVLSGSWQLGELVSGTAFAGPDQGLFLQPDQA